VRRPRRRQQPQRRSGEVWPQDPRAGGPGPSAITRCGPVCVRGSGKAPARAGMLLLARARVRAAGYADTSERARACTRMLARRHAQRLQVCRPQCGLPERLPPALAHPLCRPRAHTPPGRQGSHPWAAAQQQSGPGLWRGG